MRTGFSLVELSIVLVILGLLTGGILAGQSLIRAAELRSVSVDIQKFQAAFYTFREKYFALPGDMTNATAFWGIAHATPATCISTNSGGAATCNGNGDGKVDYSTGANERFRAWQHLANAGLIEGNYTGMSTVNQWRSIPGDNVPKLKIPNGGLCVDWAGTTTGDATWFNRSFRNQFIIGATLTNDQTHAALFSGEDAWNIDTKMDDGKPAYGKMMSTRRGGGFAPTCATTTVEATAEYAVATSGIICTLLMDSGV